MTILLMPNLTKSRARPITQKAARLLADAGVELVMEERLRGSVEGTGIEFLPYAEALERCDVVLTIGGDGSMLHAARKIMTRPKPLIGVNSGRLGFLTIVESDELENLLRLPAGDYVVENRSVLQCCIGPDDPEPQLAMNDVVLFKESPEKTIALDIFCDDILVSSFRGDGVVISTPTGSTAYCMSAGGPILDARVAGFIVTPICPHIVHTPPMVFAADRLLRVVSRGEDEERVYVGCDGSPSVPLPEGKTVFVRQSGNQVPLIEFHDAGQLKSIDKKLKGR